MIRTLKPKRCRICARDFTPISSMSKVCSVPCSLQFARDVARKKADREARAERKATREAKERLKTRADHLRELQQVFNTFVRLRDAAQPCISCDRPATWGGQWHASHFRSVGAAPEIRFDPLNVHKACSICNNHLSGNIAGYRPRLIQKIGLDKVEWLEGHHESPKYTIDQINEMKRLYREKCKQLRTLQDRGMQPASQVSGSLPEALLPLQEEWVFRSFAEAAEDDPASGF
jgi:hypothetical protein